MLSRDAQGCLIAVNEVIWEALFKPPMTRVPAPSLPISEPCSIDRSATVSALPVEQSPAGLTHEEARRRQDIYGPNAIADADIKAWRLAIGKFWAPVPWMLEAAVCFELVLGHRGEAGIIALLLIFNAALGFLQESRAQATLDALKSRLALNASVLREGIWAIIPVAQLVPGDIIKLSLGSIVGADACLIKGNVLLDHSMLTGESVPLEASADFQTYAGALVRRGEAIAKVTATGLRSKFGRTAELVRTAHAQSTQQKAVMRVVRNLAIFDGGIVVLQVICAFAFKLPPVEIIPLTLTAILAAIPVALPATFTLASTLSAHALAKRGVLPTRLSAIDEAATMDVLCADKTGTLTRNELSVTAVRPMPGFTEQQILAFAALASSDGGRDPVDAAIRSAAAEAGIKDLPKLTQFIPFDPALKMSEAMAVNADGPAFRAVKGAFAKLKELAPTSLLEAAAADALQAQGFRVLAVGAGPALQLRLAGFVALSDPPRADSASLIAELENMGVQTIMLTGDAPKTAEVIARAVGLDGPVCPPGPMPETMRPDEFDVFAGVFPEDKFRIVEILQKDGHTVGMCGDGANDAPALRQAQMGIAVSTATDVAKSAAGIVLTEPGLGGIAAAVNEGRIAFQRSLTYALRSVTRKMDQMLFLTAGLIMTGHAILTPMLMVIMMAATDFLALSSATDNVQPSAKPNAWRIDHLTIAAIILGFCNLTFCISVLAIGKFRLGFDMETLRTLAAVTSVFSGQSVFYAVRERRRLWSSCPSLWMIASSFADISIIGGLAIGGILMKPLPVPVVAGILAAALIFAFVLDAVRSATFHRLKMT